MINRTWRESFQSLLKNYFFSINIYFFLWKFMIHQKQKQQMSKENSQTVFICLFINIASQ